MPPATVCLTALLLLGANIALSDTDELTSGNKISGPLVKSRLNPRYFEDAEGRVVYLTGSHTWNTLADMDADEPLHRFDFDAYLDFLVAHNHSFIRLWTWEVPNPRSERYERRVWAAPMPWLRTGPGNDSTGKLKFDLARENPDYFERLGRRVAMAAERGIYVSVMLFEGWAVQFAPGRSSHPFLAENNINDVHLGSDPTQIHTLIDPRVTAFQEAHIRAIVDSVADFDNVLFEIINESGIYSAAWQRHMLVYLKNYLASKGRQLPVGMTAMIYYPPGGANQILFESEADWVSPGWDTGRYLNDPEPATGSKIVLTDTDHLGGSAIGDRQWVWKSFTRGLNPIFMDRYEPPDSVTDNRYALAREVRLSMGLTRLLAQRTNLGLLSPRPELASSGYVLAGPRQIIVYQTNLRSVFVDMRDRTGTYQSEWLNPRTGEVAIGEPVSAGSQLRLIRPNFFEDDIILFLYTDASDLTFDSTEFESRARALYDASLRLEHHSAFARLLSGNARSFIMTLFSGILLGAALAVLTIIFARRRRA